MYVCGEIKGFVHFVSAWFVIVHKNQKERANRKADRTLKLGDLIAVPTSVPGAALGVVERPRRESGWKYGQKF